MSIHDVYTWLLSIILLGVSNGLAAEFSLTNQHPRIVGMNIGGPKYYDESAKMLALSRHDVVILGFYRGWEQHGIKPRQMRSLVQLLKSLNPDLLVGQYTILQESQDDPKHPSRGKADKLTKEDWWLRDAGGRRVQWTGRYNAWDINITKWMRPDDNGERYSEWLAAYDFDYFFGPVPEFDIWYFDNALSRPAAKTADWNRDGENDGRNVSKIGEMYREGNVRHWSRAGDLRPGVLLVGNSDDLSSPEYRGQLHGAFLEAIIGRGWSTETRLGWDAAMARYREAMRDTKRPHLVVFNVHGKPDDYTRMRYGLASSLMDNGMYSYSEADASYRTAIWFDEFDMDLGEPIDPPQVNPSTGGIFIRRFSQGMAIVNPNTVPVTIKVEPGYQRLLGGQDPITNDGSIVDVVEIPPKDGLLLLKVEISR